MYPYYANGDLRYYARKNTLTQGTKLRFMLEIAKGMQYMHNVQKRLHRDLKPENILIDDSLKARITDFGLAKSAATHQATICGTQLYMAPEMHISQYNGTTPFYTFNADVYSYGVLCYEMWIDFKEFYLQNHTPLKSEFEIAPKGLEEMLSGALQHDPNLRTRSFDTIIAELEKIL